VWRRAFFFARFHFRDLAVVQHEAADQLHVKMAHVQEAASRLACQRKRGTMTALTPLPQFLFVGGLFGPRFSDFPELSVFSAAKRDFRSSSLSCCISGSERR